MATNKTDKVLNVPTLRFPGFTDEWQKSALGDICTVQMCKRIFAHQTTETGDVPFYKIGTIGGIPDSYISKDLFNEYRRRYSYPKEGEVMITCAGTVGKAIPFDGEDSYFQDSNIVWLSNPTSKIDNKFLYYIISRVDWSRLNSTTITRIYNDDLRKLGICYPNRIEQKKIADFLSLLDERIALQSKLIDRLKSLMDGIIDKVTARTPNISIGECLDCYSSTLQEGDAEEQGMYPVYGANGVCGYLDYATVSAPAILIVKDGSGVGNVSYTNGDCSVVGTLNYLRPKKGVSAKFLYFVLKRFNFQPYKTGMAIPHIYFKGYAYSVPTMKNNREQRHTYLA